MADILVYNALKEFESSVNVKNDLSIDKQELKDAIDSTIASQDYTGAEHSNGVDLYRLSCNTQIAHCLCNYVGSGTGSTVGGSAWTELDTFSVDNTTLYNKIINKSGMNSISARIDEIEITALKDNVKQFIEVYAKEQIDKLRGSDPRVGFYWLRHLQYQYPEDMKVCSSCFNYGFGADCLWTVPHGTSEAKFQLWGAGSGSNSSCCCGGAPFGANGAYSELTINVTPGDQYCICAGCSCCKYCCSNTPPGCACMSGVTGPGICCLKADGGVWQNCGALNGLRSTLGFTTVCQRFQSPYCTSSGPCWCSYGEYCGSNSCATCGVVPVHADCCSGRTYCACGDPLKEQCKGGYRPIHGGGCLDTNLYGYHTRPPIIDSDTCNDFSGGCACGTFTSGSCCGGCNGNGWTRHPGHGGAYTHTMGGSTQGKQGIGTAGMVKVSWK